MNNKFAIVTMAIGDKYRKKLSFVHDVFEGYAKKCGADLRVCTEPLDSTFRRNLLCQKLLIPTKYKDYDWICFLDLDILISNNAPSIFDEIDDSFSFSAVMDKRESSGFKNTVIHVWNRPDILEETHRSYFSARGFSDNELIQGSINGGVLLCNPAKIACLFEDAYWSNLPGSIHEEAIAAYVSQTNNQFKPLDERFNVQLLHELSADHLSSAFKSTQGNYFRILRRLHDVLPGAILRQLYPSAYKKFVAEKMKESFMLHFAGGYPFVGLSYE